MIRAYIAAGTVVLLIAGVAFLRWDAANDADRERVIQNQSSDRATIERVNNAIRRNDNAADALERLSRRNAAN